MSRNCAAAYARSAVERVRDDPAARLTLLDDREAARQLAETALDYARAHHQASTMATSMAWVYRQMVAGAVQ